MIITPLVPLTERPIKNMKKKHTGLVLIFLVAAISLILILKMPNEEQAEIIEGETSYYSWDTLKPCLELSGFITIQYYFTGQSKEYQRVLDLFIQSKDSLKEIIEEMNKIETQKEYCVYFLGSDWKKQLDFIPGSDYLKSYQNYFFIYEVEDTVDESDAYRLSGNPDEDLYQRVTANNKLVEQLNQVGKSDLVMQMLFCKEGVWIKFIGPFFKEEVMPEFGYIYKGSEEDSTEECGEEMWIDENWIFYVPYAPYVEGWIPMYKRFL